MDFPDIRLLIVLSQGILLIRLTTHFHEIISYILTISFFIKYRFKFPTDFFLLLLPDHREDDT